MRNSVRETVIVWVSVAAFVVGTAITFLGLLLPPKGEIDNSVLVAAGQFLTLCGAGLGVKEYVDARITREKMKIATDGNNNE